MKKVNIGSATLYLGDTFDILPELDIVADSVISDPPYGITAHHWDKAPPLDTMWNLFESKSKENANYVLFCAGGFTIDLVNSKRTWYRYDLCWVKNNKTGFLNAALMPLRNHENILVFGKPGHQKTATFNPIEGAIHPSSAFKFDHDRGNGQQGMNLHPTMKPLLLMCYMISLYSNPGDLILDPFAGSGTTGAAAIRANRRFIGIEKERKFFDIACQRLEEAMRYKERFKRKRVRPVNARVVNNTTHEEETTVSQTT
jgi:site-specific DNA-methyltransferase (adenine-specific)